jgi:hypothetical protein
LLNVLPRAGVTLLSQLPANLGSQLIYCACANAQLSDDLQGIPRRLTRISRSRHQHDAVQQSRTIGMCVQLENGP